MTMVDTGTLEKTIGNLDRALSVLSAASSAETQWTARNSVILEFTLCWGRVRPALERALIRLSGLDHDDVKVMTLGELIRAASERGYTSIDWVHWKSFRDARNAASHEYREELAESIVSEARRFLDAVSEVAASIRRKAEQ